jgi:ATP phosphoribosyltransferase regulatory subunit
MKYIPNTPEGTRDRLFGECRERRQVQTALTKLFCQRGYTEIITPDVEYYDVFTLAGNSIPQEAMLKVIDKSGKICVLRPDGTTPIARVAATKLKDMILPRRFYYNQNVYRSSSGNKGENGEIPQCGAELIGASGRKADLEMIVAAVDAIRACGVEQFHVEIGHAGIFSSFMKDMELDEESIEGVRKLIEGKNFAALGDYLSNYDEKSGCTAVKRLAYLFGGAEVLDEAEELLGRKDESIQYLRELYDTLQAAGYSKYIRFDLGMVHQIDYYTGVIFRGYVEGAGNAVLSGGRYDTLCESFGRPAQAIGFAVDVDAVASCLPKVELPQVKTVIHYEPSMLAKALEIVDSLPQGSSELSPCSRLEGTLNLAKEKNIGTVIVLDENGQREVQV